MEKYIEICILFDFYGEFLTEKQRIILDLYYNNNYSLGEIAEKLNISRQGVYDTLKRAEEIIYEFDKKLELKEKYKTNYVLINSALEKLRYCIENNTDKETSTHEILLDIENDLEKALRQI
ncbi:MAG: YlxM family DNA-binding protein [Eubacteriaceae bacterium]